MAKHDLIAQANAATSLIAGLRRGDSLTIGEIADRVGMDTKLALRLIHTLEQSGVPPFGAGSTVDLIIEGQGDDTVVTVYNDMPALSRAVRLTDEQAAALVMALMMAGIGYREPLTQKILASCATSFNEAFFERQLRIASPESDPEVAETIAFALDKGYGIDIVYVNRRGERSERTVEPLSEFTEGSTIYLVAYCQRDGVGKTFRVSAIESARINRGVVVRRTLDDVAAADGRAPDSYQRAIDPALVGVAHIEFASAGDLWRQDWPDLDGEKTMVNGAVRASIPLVNEEWVARKIAGYGGRVKVLSPDTLRREVVRCAQELRTELLGGE